MVSYANLSKAVLSCVKNLRSYCQRTFVDISRQGVLAGPIASHLLTLLIANHVQQMDHTGPAAGRCIGPASGRCIGQVRKCLDKTKWSARFKFRQHGSRTSFEAPPRALQADAETDRKLAAAALSDVPLSSRVHSVQAGIQSLHLGDENSIVAVPCSASTHLDFDAEQLRKRKKTELRNLATLTPGIVRDKKNSKGNWRPKILSELNAELLAVRTPSESE